MSSVREGIVAGLGVLAILFALGSYNEIISGDIQSGVTPSWVDFAIAHPTLFAFILAVGVAVFGGAFTAVIRNA